MADIFLNKAGIAADVKSAVDSIYSLFKLDLDDVEGKVWIAPSTDIHAGTSYHDIDILIMGYLNGYTIAQIGINNNISIESFCTTIEVKAHSGDGIIKDGTRVFVKYNSKDHDVTEQSEGQKRTLVKFLEEVLQYENRRVPRVSNLIWLSGINKEDFRSEIGNIPPNVLTCDSSTSDIFEAIGKQYYIRDNGFVDAFKNMSEEEIENIANIFCAKVRGADTMTLRKMNALLAGNGSLIDLEQKIKQIIVLRGHAGTGKTIMLLQAADFLTRKGKKCVFLTYNVALISDINHTMNYMPKTFSNFEIQSMHSFMISILYKNGLWKASNKIESDFLPAVASLYRMLINNPKNIQYDYVFIDEAQDWELTVTNTIKKLCQNSHIVIADGIDQFMQKGESANWGLPDYAELKKCLRQRNGLTCFAIEFAKRLGVAWNVMPNKELPGGKVIVTNKYDEIIHTQLVNDAKSHGCTEYDIMLLAPKSLISENGTFSLISAYRSKGIELFDGIDKSNRYKTYDDNNAANGECRVFTYESCRGLEAWTTVCLRFDELFEKEHPHFYKEINYEAARIYMLTLWTLIPLTRAVDTLVLVAKKDSKTYKMLLDLKEDLPDIITVID